MMAKTNTMPAHPHGSVLLVEDNEDCRELYCELIEQEGYTVHSAENGTAALACLARGARPGLILLDMHMPDMDGYTFVERLSKDESLSRIPVVVASGSAHLNAPWARTVLMKPFAFDVLLDAVKEHCEATL